jgi:hypothetical protein
VGFDRSLTKADLDAALVAERRDQLPGGRVGAHLNRIWLAPPAHAASVVGWARENRALDPTGTFLHFGALLATTPFVVPVAVAAGRQVAKGGGVDPARLVADASKALGDAPSTATGVRNVLATLRNIGLFIGSAERPLGTRPPVPKPLAGWFTHVVLVARRAYEVTDDAWRTAPELGLLGARPTGGVQRYPHFDLHMKDGRTLVRER